MSARARGTTTPGKNAPVRAIEDPTTVRPPSARAINHVTTTKAPPARATSVPTSRVLTPARDALLEQIRLLGRTLDDLERMRIMGGNRVGAFERELGLKMDYHDVIQKQLKVAEHIAELELKRAWRKHPLSPWAKGVRGVGEKSIARLIAEVGDPADRPNPGKLLAYCGHGEALRKRRKGMSQEELFRCGNPRAKTLVYLIAESLLKAGVRKGEDDTRHAITPQGELYLARRATTAATHPDWTDGHSHADALRIVGKEFLKDLWCAATGNARADQMSHDNHASSVRAGHSASDTQNPDARAGHRFHDAHSRTARAGQSPSTQSLDARAGGAS